MLVELEEAEAAFIKLPTHLQIVTLSPAYCAVDALRDPALESRFLLFRCANGMMLHSVHESPTPAGGFDWQSPYGYGGPIGVGMVPTVLRDAWNEFDGQARDRAVIAEFLRFHPLAGNHSLYPGTVRDDRAVVNVKLSSPELAATYSVRARNTLRKAQNIGLESTWENPVSFHDKFIAFYYTAMRSIGASDFYLFRPEYFSALFALPCTRLLVIRLESEVVAAGIFLFGREVAEYHLSGTSPDGRAAGATNLMLHQAACTAQAEGLKSLYLGGGTDSSPDNALLRFKQSFAPALDIFKIGSRVLNPVAYESIRNQFPEAAKRSNRVLFYRS